MASPASWPSWASEVTIFFFMALYLLFYYYIIIIIPWYYTTLLHGVVVLLTTHTGIILLVENRARIPKQKHNYTFIGHQLSYCLDGE